jgi:hypothetical protein
MVPCLRCRQFHPREVRMSQQITRQASPARSVTSETGISRGRRWRAVLDRLGQTRALAHFVDDDTSWMNY